MMMVNRVRPSEGPDAASIASHQRSPPTNLKDHQQNRGQHHRQAAVACTSPHYDLNIDYFSVVC